MRVVVDLLQNIYARASLHVAFPNCFRAKGREERIRKGTRMASGLRSFMREGRPDTESHDEVVTVDNEARECVVARSHTFDLHCQFSALKLTQLRSNSQS